MTDERLDELIDHHLNDEIDEQGVAELEARLLHSAADRERFWALAEVHTLLHEHGQRQVGSRTNSESADGSPGHLVVASNRRAIEEQRSSRIWSMPWAAAAVGLVVFFFGASVMWAMTSHQRREPRSWPLPLIDGGFETSEPPGDAGVPSRTRVWGGDFARAVKNESNVEPIEGHGMLMFLRGDNRVTPPGIKSSVAEMWQVVDFAPQSGVSKPVVEVSARFNLAGDAALERVAFAVGVLAFAGEASQMPDLWRGHRELALAAATKEEMADSDPTTWQTLTAQVTVPPEANLLLVQVRATRKGPGPKSQEFGRHFVDDVRLRLVETQIVSPRK